MRKGIITALVLLLALKAASAQTTFGGVLKIDRTVMDWGDVTVKDGPLQCTFNLENVSEKDIVVSNVISSCGCTGVKWTREAIKPGGKGTIHATYSNDEGPSQFDKTLSVYVEGIRKPLILHLRGTVHKKKLPLAETYPVHFGPLALRKSTVKVGNLSQGEEKSTMTTLANIGKKAIEVSFSDISDFLTISPSTLSIPPLGTAEITVTVTSDRSRWGKNIYYATPVIDGKESDGKIAFTAITKENFSTATGKGSRPDAEYEGSVSPTPVAPGERMEAVFRVSNKGTAALELYRIDFESGQVQMLHPAGDQATIAPGRSLDLKFRVRTESMKADSDNLCVISIYTNDPEHSIINLYIDAIIL